MLTFVVPVRHPANAADWPELCRRLAQTAGSIAAQTDDRWQAVIVANHEAALPALPAGFSVVRVDFPPNPLQARGGEPLEVFYDAIRIDKGRRVLAGLLSVRPTGYVMSVDDDDFVSRELAAYVARHDGANGWYFDDGYVWGDGGALVFRYSGFSQLCGTSHIVRHDLLTLPSDAAHASDVYIRRLLGSHIFLESHLADAGTPLARLPFRGGMYRIGYRGSHSQSSGLRAHFFGRELLRQPWKLPAQAARLRFLTPSLRREYFGTGSEAKPSAE
jgi:hypothetical protein